VRVLNLVVFVHSAQMGSAIAAQYLKGILCFYRNELVESCRHPISQLQLHAIFYFEVSQPLAIFSLGFGTIPGLVWWWGRVAGVITRTPPARLGAWVFESLWLLKYGETAPRM
jgi:hypothetical protein